MADDGERAPVPLRGDGRRSSRFVRSESRHDPRSATEERAPVIAALDSPLLDPVQRLEAILQMVERAREEWQEAVALADEFGAGRLPKTTREDAEAVETEREQARANVRKTYARYYDYTVQAHKAEQEVRRRRLETGLVGKWLDEFYRLRAELTDEYAGLGPHYDLLCDNTAVTAVRLRQMEESGRDFDSTEYIDVHKLHLAYVNQLQKYTEAMKSESINRQTQEVAEEMVKIFERHFGAKYSQEWQVVVGEITEMIGSRVA